MSAADQDDRSARQAWRGERALMLADFAHSIALVEAVGRVENDLAETLRAMAAQGESEARTRRLTLAKDAEGGAQAAARISDRLQELACRWAERDEVAILHRALEHAASVLADLDRAEGDLAGILTGLASRSGPVLAVRRRLLAAEASAAAQRARDRAHALRQLAQTDGAGAPDGAAVADPVDGLALPGASCQQWLADNDRRLTQLRQARLEPVAHSRQLVAQGFLRAASAHDHVAQADERSARAGVGDVAAHKRRAAFHRAAAEADRQRAQEIQSQLADPQRSA